MRQQVLHVSQVAQDGCQHLIRASDDDEMLSALDHGQSAPQGLALFRQMFQTILHGNDGIRVTPDGGDLAIFQSVSDDRPDDVCLVKDRAFPKRRQEGKEEARMLGHLPVDEGVAVTQWQTEWKNPGKPLHTTNREVVADEQSKTR